MIALDLGVVPGGLLLVAGGLTAGKSDGFQFRCSSLRHRIAGAGQFPAFLHHRQSPPRLGRPFPAGYSLPPANDRLGQDVGADKRLGLRQCVEGPGHHGAPVNVRFSRDGRRGMSQGVLCRTWGHRIEGRRH
jgi:hypothetical protein